MSSKIDESLHFDDLMLVKHLKERDSPFISTVKDVYEDVADSLNNRIQIIFPKYTLHNTGHSFRIMQYMAKLVEDITLLTDLEIALLICSALLHDVGMAVSENDIQLIKAEKFDVSDIKYSAMLRLMSNKEELAIQEYVRRIHAKLSARYIRNHLKDKLHIPSLNNLDFTDELANICESHTNDIDWLKANLKPYDVKGDYAFNAQYIACILRIADILDIDGNRTPYRLYKLIAPKGISDEEWKQHFVISNNEKIIPNPRTKQKEIVFHGRSNNADTHRKILNYIDWVEIELTNGVALVEGMPNQYNLFFDTKPKVFISTEGYTFSGYKMTLKFSAISSLLMGEKIYGNKSLGLRELIQNALDACKIRQENEPAEYGEDAFEPRIKVILDSENDIVRIKDNGTGMSLDVIKKHFLNIGVSYYRSFDFLLKDFEYNPIGNYGIGFLSCFMLSDKVTVFTRHYKSKDKYKIELEKGNEWTSLTQTEDITFDGTEVILNYNEFMAVFDHKLENVAEFLNKYFLTDGVDFKLIDKPDKIINIVNSVNIDSAAEKGMTKISFNEDFGDFEGYAIIKNKTKFVRNAAEIGLDKDVYLYSFNTAAPVGNTASLEYLKDLSAIKIDNFLIDWEIRYLSIPIIQKENENEFISGMKFTDDDIVEVIDKLEKKLKWITILVAKDRQKHLSEGIIDVEDDVIDGIGFDQLVGFGQSGNCATYKFLKTVKLFEGRKNELYLPFNNEKKPYWYPWASGPRQELFIRNVLIKDFHFNFQVSTTVIDVVEMIVNIKSRKFIPDISRNNIDTESEQTINYVIGKAIHVGVIENMGYSADEQNTLQAFVNKFYDTKLGF